MRAELVPWQSIGWSIVLTANAPHSGFQSLNSSVSVHSRTRLVSSRRSVVGAQRVVRQPSAARQCAHSAGPGSCAVARRVARLPPPRVARAGREAHRATQLRRARDSLPQKGVRCAAAPMHERYCTSRSSPMCCMHYLRVQVHLVSSYTRR